MIQLKSSQAHQETLTECVQMRFIHILLPLVLQCLDSIGQKDHQQRI